MGNQIENKPKEKRVASIAPLTEALEDCWSAIRKNHPKLPEVVILIESNSATVNTKKKDKFGKLGHFYNTSWRDKDGTMYHEVVITGEHLARPATAIFGTLLHEAAHALNFVQGLTDTSRQGRYHNKTFKNMAMQLGMVCEKMQSGKTSFGWAITKMTPDTVQKYKTPIKNLKSVIDSQLVNLPPAVREWYAKNYDDGIIDLANLTEEEIQAILDADAEEQANVELEKKKKKARDGPWDLECKCPMPRILKSIRKVTYLEGDIICGECNQKFEKKSELHLEILAETKQD